MDVGGKDEEGIGSVSFCRMESKQMECCTREEHLREKMGLRRRLGRGAEAFADLKFVGEPRSNFGFGGGLKFSPFPTWEREIWPRETDFGGAPWLRPPD